MESNTEEFYNEDISFWLYLPEPVLFQIFSYLNHKELLTVGEVCRRWFEVSRDDLLWRDLFYKNFKIDRSVPIIAGELIRVNF